MKMLACQALGAPEVAATSIRNHWLLRQLVHHLSFSEIMAEENDDPPLWHLLLIAPCVNLGQ